MARVTEKLQRALSMLAELEKMDLQRLTYAGFESSWLTI
jgi:hypothetical protein